MPSVDDVYNKLVEANTNLQQLHADLGHLVALGTYANEAAYHNSEQNDTIICILEKISKNTCQLVNEAHIQTGLQTSMEASARLAAELYKTTHAEAALELQRHEELRAQIEECCPPEPVRPPCAYEPCKAPDPLKPPEKRNGPIL